MKELYLCLNMEKLDTKFIASLNSALSKMSGHTRRLYAAELALDYFGGSARATERALNVSRSMVGLGLREKASGIECLGAFSLRGSKKKK